MLVKNKKEITELNSFKSTLTQSRERNIERFFFKDRFLIQAEGPEVDIILVTDLLDSDLWF